MRSFRRSVPLAIALAAVATILAVSSSALAQGAFDGVEIQATHVAGSIHMLTGAGGNIGVSAGEDGVFLIDDQFAPLTDKIRAAVAKISDAPLRFVLNTHWHDDHSGGNENLGKAGVLIVAHDNARTRMTQKQFLEIFDNHVPPSPKVALPVVTFSDTVTFHMNGEEIHAFHVNPAHTDGDSIVHFKQVNAVHMGDIFFSGMYPFIDTSTGGNIDGMIAAVDRTLGMIDGNTKIIPGHGPLSTRADLMAYRHMLSGVRDAVATLVAAGKSLEEVVAAKPTAPWDEKWSREYRFAQPDIFTGIVYDSLKMHSLKTH